jgi:hypothetical protein
LAGIETMELPTETRSPGRFPLAAALAACGIIALVAFGGFAMYQRTMGTSADLRGLQEIRGAGGGRRTAMPQPRVAPDGVRERGNNAYQVKAGDALLSISQRRGGEWNFNYSYERTDLLTPDQQAVFTARFRLTRDPAYARSLEVSEEQIKKLNAIPARDGMILTDADRQRIEKLFDDYRNASPPRDAQTAALVAGLREVAAASLERTRKVLGERAAEIALVLTPQQIEPFRRGGN